MGEIKVNPRDLEQAERQLKALTAQLHMMKTEFDAVKNSVDSEIRSRRNIDYMMREFSLELEYLERGLKERAESLNKARMEYEEAERALKRKLRELEKPTVQSGRVSPLDRLKSLVGKGADKLKEILGKLSIFDIACSEITLQEKGMDKLFGGKDREEEVEKMVEAMHKEAGTGTVTLGEVLVENPGCYKFDPEGYLAQQYFCIWLYGTNPGERFGDPDLKNSSHVIAELRKLELQGRDLSTLTVEEIDKIYGRIAGNWAEAETKIGSIAGFVTMGYGFYKAGKQQAKLAKMQQALNRGNKMNPGNQATRFGEYARAEKAILAKIKIKENVPKNLAKSKLERQSSKFREYAKAEKAILERIKAAEVNKSIKGSGSINRTYSGDLMDSETAKRYDNYWRNSGIGSDDTWNAFAKNNPNSSIDDYFRLVKEQSPWPDGYTPNQVTLKQGDTFKTVLNSDQPITSPGRFATTSDVPDVKFVRENLAVKDAWKTDPSIVVEYSVKENIQIPALTGPVGPQVDLGANKYLPGGADQINILLDRNVNMMDYLDIKGVSHIN